MKINFSKAGLLFGGLELGFAGALLTSGPVVSSTLDICLYVVAGAGASSVLIGLVFPELSWVPKAPATIPPQHIEPLAAKPQITLPASLAQEPRIVKGNRTRSVRA